MEKNSPSKVLCPKCGKPMIIVGLPEIVGSEIYVEYQCLSGHYREKKQFRK